MARRYRKARRGIRRPKRVPGWGGVAGRIAGMGMKYVSKGGMAYKALKLARKVADAVNTEYHQYDTSAVAGAVDYSGGITTLNGMAQGNTDITRVGDSIKNQNLVMRFQSNRNGQDCRVRLIVFWDPQNQITAASQLLESVGSAISVLSPKNYDLRFRSKVLFDKTYSVTSQYTIIGDELSVPINQHTQFSAGSTTINSGALKFCVISNVVTTNLPTFSYYARLTFTDN